MAGSVDHLQLCGLHISNQPPILMKFKLVCEIDPIDRDEGVHQTPIQHEAVNRPILPSSNQQGMAQQYSMESVVHQHPIDRDEGVRQTPIQHEAVIKPMLQSSNQQCMAHQDSMESAVHQRSNHQCIGHEEVLALLEVGTAAEVHERAARARQEKSEKGQRARDAKEVLDIIGFGGYNDLNCGEWIDITSAVCDAVAKSLHYPERHWRTSVTGLNPGHLGEIVVQNCTVLSAMQELASLIPDAKAVGALNFASARNPGGGFTTGAAAQEESIARSSALYPCLTKFFKEFFLPSRRAASGAYTHDIIFSPRVPVLRDDVGCLLAEPYLVDFVTAAAPNVCNLKAETAEKEAEGILQERIPRVLEVFSRHNVADLVLGAWGCGVFGNSPDVVARIFRENLSTRFRGRFRNIVFAVLDITMAQAFAKEFRKEVIPPSSVGSVSGAKGFVPKGKRR
jgi:uncharacterized protein (TIGR02452 family)